MWIVDLFKPKFNGENWKSWTITLNEHISLNIFESLGDNRNLIWKANGKNWKNWFKYDTENLNPSTEEITKIIDICINNNSENIDTEDIEENFENTNIEKYIATYKSLLEWMKNIFLNYKISENHKSELFNTFDKAKRKQEIMINDICIILNILSEYLEPSSKLYIKDEHIINVSEKDTKDLESKEEIFLSKLLN